MLTAVHPLRVTQQGYKIKGNGSQRGQAGLAMAPALGLEESQWEFAEIEKLGLERLSAQAPLKLKPQNRMTK